MRNIFENDLFDVPNERHRIISFDANTVVYNGNMNNQTYWFNITADIIDDHGSVHTGKTVEFRYDREFEGAVDVCSQFKDEESIIQFDDYPIDHHEIIIQIKKRIAARLKL